jgi:hypothetical protein
MTGPSAAVDSSSGRSRNSRGSCFAPAPGNNGHPRASPLTVLDELLLHIVITVEQASRSAWLHSLRASVLRARSGPIWFARIARWVVVESYRSWPTSLDIPLT